MSSYTALSARNSSPAASWKKYGQRLILQGLMAGAVLASASPADAAVWTWDADPATAGLQDGSSTTNWSTSSAVRNWWNGTQNVVWTNSTGANPIFAQFGSGGASATKTVTVTGTVGVAGLRFAEVSAGSSGYTLTGGNIAIENGGTITLTDGATTAQTFATINSNISGSNITLRREGASAEQFLALTGSNTWTGRLTIGGGAAGLFIRTSGAAALNTLTTVEVQDGSTLSLQGNNANYTSNFVLAGLGGGTGSGQRGAIRFDNSMTLSGTITLSNSAVLNFQSSTPTAANVVFTQGIGETGGSFDFTKTGLGTLTLRGASTYTGATVIDAVGSAATPGTLLLDFANSTVTDNLLYNGVAASVLYLSGVNSRGLAESTATLAIAGKAGTVNSQTFDGLLFDGPAALTVTSGATGSVNVSLGDITRDITSVGTAAGATLTITGPASGSIITTSNRGTLLGPWATYTNANGTGATGWAGSNSSGVLGIFTGETPYATGTSLSEYAATINMKVSSTSTGNVTQGTTATIGTISMADTAVDRVITIGTGNRLSTGGVQLVAGSKNVTIGNALNAGTLTSTSDSGAELFLSNFDPTSLLTVNSVIANGSNGTLVILNGTGTTVFAGNNTYTGSTIVSSGILELRSDTALGNTSSGTSVANGATLRLAGGLSIAEGINLGGSGVAGAGALLSVGIANSVTGTLTITGDARIAAAAGNTLTLNGINASNNAGFGGAGTINVTGRISGTTISKTDSGTLILGGANTYAGSTTISSGVVRVTNATGLGSTAAGTIVENGAALELSNAAGLAIGTEAFTLSGTGINEGGALRNVLGNNSIAGRITIGGATRINSDSGTLTLDVASGAAITSSVAQNLTFGGAGNIVVADAITTLGGTVTKDGTGTVTFGGANTYTGVTTILGGTLALGANDVFANSAPLIVNGGTFSIGTFSDTLNTVTLQNGAITGTTGVLTAGSFSVMNGVVSANLGGAAATLTKSTSGTVTLSGANTYGGQTSANAGRLILDYSTGNTVLGATNAVALAGGTLEIKGGAAATPISLGDIFMVASTGMSTFVAGNNAAITATNITRGSGSSILLDLSAAGSSLRFTGTPPTKNGQLMGVNGSNAAIVMKDGNGKYDFAALGTGNSVVRLNAATALPSSGGADTTPYVLNADGTTFGLTGNVTSSSLRIDTGTTGGVLDLAGRTLNLSLFGLLVDGSSDYTITSSTGAGALAGSAAVYVYQFGTGKLTLDAPINSLQAFFMGTGLVDWRASTGVANTNHIYGSTLRISGTAISMGSTGTGNTAVLNISNGGILELAYDGDGTAGSGDFTRSLGSGAGNVRFLGEGGFSAYGGNRIVNLGGSATTIVWGASNSNFLASGNKFILGSKYANAVVDFQNGLDLNGATQTIEVQSVNQAGIGGKISGNIIGTGSLAKTGQGILTLAGANTYTGSTLVSEGTLAVTGSILNSSTIGVSTGAELHVASAASVAAGSLALDNASKLSLEVGTLTSSTISLTGTATLSGSITLALTLLSDPTDGQLFTFIDSAMLAGYSTGARFLYNGLALNEGDFFTVANNGFSQIFQFSYQGGGDGGNVTALAVPEPSTAFTLLASTSLLLGLNRFRRPRRHLP